MLVYEMVADEERLSKCAAAEVANVVEVRALCCIVQGPRAILARDGSASVWGVEHVARRRHDQTFHGACGRSLHSSPE